MSRLRTPPVTRLIKELALTEDGGAAMLAVRLGVSPSTLSRWQKGKNRPQPEMENQIRCRVPRGRTVGMGLGLPFAFPDAQPPPAP